MKLEKLVKTFGFILLAKNVPLPTLDYHMICTPYRQYKQYPMWHFSKAKANMPELCSLLQKVKQDF